MSTRVVNLRILLLEDLHTGSGLGQGSVDAGQARDRYGRPVIWWSHLKGVLRAAAEDLRSRGVSGIDPVGLFGWDSRVGTGPETGRVTVGSAYLDEQASLPRERWFLNWSSTAREVNSRMPLEDTKHTDEYIAAGCEFQARCELPASDLAAFQAVAAGTTRLGAKRSRGALVCIDLHEQESSTHALPVGEATRVLRMRLRARDPLCFPTTPSASNIVDSQPYMPGSALLGALVNAIKPTAMPESDPLLVGLLDSRAILVGNGYPLPADWSPARLSTLELLPAPISHRLTKRSAKSSLVPDWAPPVNGASKYLDTDQDQLGRDYVDPSGGKRLPDDAYILRYSRKEAWRLFRTPLMQRMRIGAPDVGWDEDTIDEEDLRNLQDLFTSEEIPEDTEFVADVLFEDKETADKFATRLSHRSGDLKLGRGGRPVEIVSAAWVGRNALAEFDCNASSLRIVLESDLILRGPRLGFVTQLDRAGLQQMLEDAGKPSELLKTLTVDARIDTTAIGGFNASSGLPRAVQLALRRGSSVLLKGEVANLQSLHAVMGSKPAWGERTHEGHGRLRIYSGDWAGQPTQNEAVGSRSVARKAHRDESIAAEMAQTVAQSGWSIADLFKKLSRSNVYDFATLAKSKNADFEKRFIQAWTHYADRKDFHVPGAAALNDMRWPKADDASLQSEARLRLYYAARWAIALGRDTGADAADSDESAPERGGEPHSVAEFSSSGRRS